jgi:hypothetical protein
MKVTRIAAILWVVAIVTLVLGLVIPSLRALLVVAGVAVVACVVLGFQGRSRPDVELTPDERERPPADNIS